MAHLLQLFQPGFSTGTELRHFTYVSLKIVTTEKAERLSCSVHKAGCLCGSNLVSKAREVLEEVLIHSP